jgi:iron complex transport system ATP-binding protein
VKEPINIRVKGASFGYAKKNPVEVLSGVNLTFNGGDFVGIVGLNGTGKSTFIKSLCGLLPLLDGDILFNGKSIRQLSLNEISRQAAIVLTEKIGGFNLTVFDAVAAGQMPYTNSFNRLEQPHIAAISEAIGSCGISSFVNKPLTELSDGMFQKTMIARAIAQQTPLMLLDEPTAFLDYASKHNLFSQLRALSDNENKCILLSSHDLDLVTKYCKAVAVVSGAGIKLMTVENARKDQGFLNIGGGFI